jgi:hypothetical protein
MSLAGLEPAISESELSQTHTLDRAAMGLALFPLISLKNVEFVPCINIRALTGNIS